MNPISGNGELPLLCDDNRIVAFDSLEQWQIDQLTSPVAGDSSANASASLAYVDHIVQEWLENLTKEEWAKIRRQKSLFGIKLPDKWIVVWRFILKNPDLRDSERAARGGKGLNSYAYFWNIWSEDCIDKYLSAMDKDLLRMVDQGYLYGEIGQVMLSRYGDSFWKPRKVNTKTTPSQVVNNYLYQKLPNKIVRGELTDLVKMRLNRLAKIKR